ncbi:MAG: hypothetical protein GY757_00505, partial [bacterium]|nr:hypothetical protein [bacterium]
GKKDAHHLLVRGETVYALDNVVYPTFILTLDIAAPGEIKAGEPVEIIGINQHLEGQALDTEKRAWYILQSEHSMSSNGIKLLECDIKTGRLRNVFEEPFYQIFVGIISGSPPLVVFRKDKQLFLAEIKTGFKGLEFINPLPLPLKKLTRQPFSGSRSLVIWYMEDKINIKRDTSYLYIVYG